MAPDNPIHESHIPHTPGAVNRPRLIERLGDRLERKLTLISAPPGYGKTTLAAQFVLTLKQRQIVWQRLGEQDRDVFWLYRNGIEALRRTVRLERKIRLEPSGDRPVELAAYMANALHLDGRQRLVYVIDDAHYLLQTDATQDWLRRLVELLPSNCHLMLLTRDMPRLPYAELIARNDVTALNADELRFTVRETYELASQVLDHPPSESRIRQMVDQLEGWPAGVMLALQPMSRGLEQAMLGGHSGPEALFNALAGSMLESQPAPLRKFLLESSTFAVLTPERCTDILGLVGAELWLDEAYRHNLFLTRVSGGYEYHSLFRVFLQNQLELRAPDRYRGLHHDAARWYEQQGDIEQALEHYLAAGHTELAAALAERLAPSYDAQDRVETLFNWNRRLKAAGIVSPTLAYICARGHIDRYEYDAAQDELDRAEVIFRKNDDELGLNKVSVRRATIDILQGRPQIAAANLQAMLSTLPDSDNLRGRAMGILGRARLHQGQTETAGKILEQALELYRADGDQAALSHVLQDLSIAYFRQGKLDKATTCLQEHVAIRRSLGGAGALGTALNNLGYFYHQFGDYRQAAETFQEGLAVVARVSDRRTECFLLWSLGDLYRDLGHFERAVQHYTRTLHLNAEDEPLLSVATLVSASTLYRWKGDLGIALDFAQQALELASTLDAQNDQLMARAALLAARGQRESSEDSSRELARIAAELEEKGARSERLSVLGMQAVSALKSGDETTCSRVLDEAQSLAQQIGLWQPLVVEAAHSPILNTHLHQQPNRYRHLLASLQALQSASDIALFTSAAVLSRDIRTYRLRLYLLGDERIERDGHLLSAADWRAITAREMFLYLQFNGPSNREAISLAFWPDASPERVRSNFHTTLYRARQAVGEDVILFEDGRYLINPDVDIWCDAIEMEKACDLARLLPPRDARTEDLWRQAVDLYQGSLLPSLYADWIERRRTTVEELYMESLLGMSECARARRDYQAALRWLGRALDIDPLREDIHRTLMITYSKMGERRLVARQYEMLRQHLHQEMGILPSQETESLARLLLN